jgi:hypothetical protein
MRWREGRGAGSSRTRTVRLVGKRSDRKGFELFSSNRGEGIEVGENPSEAGKRDSNVMGSEGAGRELSSSSSSNQKGSFDSC